MSKLQGMNGHFEYHPEALQEAISKSKNACKGPYRDKKRTKKCIYNGLYFCENKESSYLNKPCQAKNCDHYTKNIPKNYKKIHKQKTSSAKQKFR